MPRPSRRGHWPAALSVIAGGYKSSGARGGPAPRRGAGGSQDGGRVRGAAAGRQGRAQRGRRGGAAEQGGGLVLLGRLVRALPRLHPRALRLLHRPAGGEPAARALRGGLRLLRPQRRGDGGLHARHARRLAGAALPRPLQAVSTAATPAPGGWRGAAGRAPGCREMQLGGSDRCGGCTAAVKSGVVNSVLLKGVSPFNSVQVH